MIAACLALLLLGGVPGSLHARIDTMREQVRQNPDLEEEQRTFLEAKLAGVDSALTGNVAENLARILGRTVSGKPPDHQRKPEWDRRHWWVKLKGFIEQIEKKGLTRKQLRRELDVKRKKGGFSEEQLVEIRKALEEAAKLMNDDPPDFPPLATP